MIFYYHANKTHFHKKGFALGLILRVRVFGTQKWPIDYMYINFLSLCVGDIVALKKLKMEKEKEGFPITSLREINTLLKAQHPNIVTVRVSVM